MLEPSTDQAPDIAQRPDNIAEKFWDMESGTVRTDDLMKSYNELEKRFAGQAPRLPETADGYDINIETEGFELDPEINARLHAAGFSNDQAQLVYDMAIEQLLPIAEQLSGSLEQRVETQRLEKHFGGKQRWSETERQLQNWGRSNLSVDAFESMSRTYDGVMAMHRMMANNEPAILGGSGAPSSGLSESELRTMMNDPRYWRDQEPSYVAQIRQGFEMLYPD